MNKELIKTTRKRERIALTSPPNHANLILLSLREMVLPTIKGGMIDMSMFDLICGLISIPVFIVALYRTSWWVRFRRGARIIEGGVIIYKIEERNVK